MGLYSPALKQLLIWNQPNRKKMLETVRHEGFHQYLDGVMSDPPPWLNEGLAMYYEALPPAGTTILTLPTSDRRRSTL